MSYRAASSRMASTGLCLSLSYHQALIERIISLTSLATSMNTRYSMPIADSSRTLAFHNSGSVLSKLCGLVYLLRTSLYARFIQVPVMASPSKQIPSPSVFSVGQEHHCQQKLLPTAVRLISSVPNRLAEKSSS